MSDIKLKIITPRTAEEFEKYYRLRWQILRQPWDQPKGSEKDQLEHTSFHIMAVADNQVIGVGRLHPVGDNIFQIRYMAVDERFRNNGVGTSVLEAIEKQALLIGAKKIILDAREKAIGFYEKKGYRITAPSHTLFGVIKHFKMEKTIG